MGLLYDFYMIFSLCSFRMAVQLVALVHEAVEFLTLREMYGGGLKLTTSLHQ